MSVPSIFPPFWRDPNSTDNSFEKLQREVERVFDSFSRGFPVPSTSKDQATAFGSFSPKLDVSETDKQLEITAEIPGVPDDAIDVSLTDNVLTIKGEKKSETEDKQKDYHVVERSYGMFQRRIPLPFDPGDTEPQATFHDGVLRIAIAKPPEVENKTRRIAIKSSS